MMVEKELRYWLHNSAMRQSPDDVRRRNVEAILSYFGFGEDELPSVRDVAERYDGLTHQRLNAIMREKLKERFRESETPVIGLVFKSIEQEDFISVPLLHRKLERRRLISDRTSIRGLLRLANYLGRAEEHEIYDSVLGRLPKRELGNRPDVFLIQQSVQEDLKEPLRMARTLPGMLGLAKFGYLKQKLSDDRLYRYLRSLITVQPNCCIVRENADTQWYILEDRENTLLNGAARAFRIAERYNSESLAGALRRHLQARTHEFDYPSTQVISNWLARSKWFATEGNVVTFLGEPGHLTDAEDALHSYLTEKGCASTKELLDYLTANGISEANARKTVYHSAFSAVGRAPDGQYEHCLLSAIEQVSEQEDTSDASRYEYYHNRLKEVAMRGTDRDALVVRRREQNVLREYLFGDKPTARCAICGGEYSVAALHAAHKKPRIACNDAERTDPLIVFPLCEFGCHHLYDSGSLRIKHGHVVAIVSGDCETEDCTRARQLAGRSIASEWTEGPEDYFDDQT